MAFSMIINIFDIMGGRFWLVLKPQTTKKSRPGKCQAPVLPHQQRFEIQHVFFPQDDEGSCATERVAAVGLQTRHATETTLPVLTAKHTKAAPSKFHGFRSNGCKQFEVYLRIQFVVFSNSFGVRMYVSDATEAAQYALLKKKTQVWVSGKSPTLGLLHF